MPVDAAFITNKPEDRFYLTGFSGSEGWVIAGEKIYLLIDSRYYLQAEEQAFPTVTVKRVKGSFRGEIQGTVLKGGLKILYYDPSYLTVAQLKQLRQGLKIVKFKPLSVSLLAWRQIKTPAEVAKLKSAQRITDSVFKVIQSNIKIGQTEKELAWQLEKQIRRRRCEVAWRPFIVAFGENTARPHHSPTEKRLQKGEWIQLDFGVQYQSYHADLSRVLFTTAPNTKTTGLYETLLKAQELGISLVKAKRKTATIDQKVRDFLASEKVEGVYQHSLGHGIGLEIHEKPSLSIKSKDRLQVGNVVTIEPGFYVEGLGGMRLEDEVWLSAEGVINLTSSPKDLKSVTINLS